MSNARHYALNRHVNSVVGNDPIDLMDRDALVQTLGRQTKLIRDEFQELVEDGINGASAQQIRDGLADIIVTVDGMYHRLSLEYPRTHLWGYDDINWQEQILTINSCLLSLEMPGADYLTEAPVSQVQNTIKVLCDGILYGVYALAAIWDVDLEEDQEAVYNSNMSKFDLDELTAADGIAKYAALEVKTELFPKELDGLTYYVIKCVVDSTGTDGKAYRVGKFLKSVLFEEPIFTSYTENHPLNEFVATGPTVVLPELA